MQAAATDEERAKLQKQMQDLMAKAGITMGGRGGDGQGRGRQGRGDRPAAAPVPRVRRADSAAWAAVRARRWTRRYRRSAGDVHGARPRQCRRYTEEERKNAKLPLPPEQDSQVQALLRPGLLADVEIEVEKIPDVLHVPAQAVFKKNGKYTVFVQEKNGKFEPREVQLVKQSESMMVLAGGVQPGEVIAMADPTADKTTRRRATRKAPPATR